MGGAPAGAVSARPRPAPSFNGTVFAVAYRGNTVYVGGSFTTASSGGRTFTRRRLAAFDAGTGRLLPWSPPVSGTVKALAVSGSSVYLAGDFGSVGGRRRDAVAQVSALSGAVGSFSHSLSGEAAALSAGNGRLYVGGRFSAVDGARRASLAAFSLAGGALDHNWRPVADNRVEAIRAAGSRVYAGGDFHRVNGVRGASRLVALDAAGGGLIPGFRPRVPAVVYGIAADRRGVLVATGGAGGKAIAYTGGGAVRWAHLFNGDVHGITTVGGTTYVGGHFDTACRNRSRRVEQLGCIGGATARVKLAALDSAGNLTGWDPHANGIVGVRALATNGDQVGAGGEFTAVGGAHRERFAASR